VPARLAADYFDGLIEPVGVFVGALRGKGVKNIGESYDPAGKRDLVLFEPLRITGAVIPLVMGKDNAPRGLQEYRGASAENVGAERSMLFYHIPLKRREAAFLLEDLPLGWFESLRLQTALESLYTE